MSADRTIRTRVAVCVVRNNEMLFVQHAKGDRRYWLLPGGGVEVGETLTEAAQREVVEETGYATTIGRLMVVCESIEPGGRHVVNMIYAAEVTGGALLAGRDGTLVDAAWHPRERISGLEMYPCIASTLLDCWDEGFAGTVRHLGNIWRPLPPER